MTLPQHEVTSTEYERHSISYSVNINLSDGHAHQPATPSQARIIQRFPELYYEANQSSQYDLEIRFIEAFLRLGGQSRVNPYSRYFLSYSASSAITMLAGYFRRTNRQVALIEPCFDNIPSILRREDVGLQVLSEEWLMDPDLEARLATLQADVIWIVMPNNPTGLVVSEEVFRSILHSCLRTRRTFVCDFCFRFFCPSMYRWDQYAALQDSNVSYATIEDTGKTWSTSEMKFGILTCSDDLYPAMHRFHDDLLLNVSPFHLKVLTDFVEDSARTGLDETILHYTQANRQTLKQAFAGSVLKSVTSEDAPIPLEWVQICASYTDKDLWRALTDRGVHILPGSNFYWHTPGKGKSYVRIPLARDPAIVAQAAPIIVEVAEQLTNRYP
jgi:aspartate/methionine/tyrosine aminotransferase